MPPGMSLEQIMIEGFKSFRSVVIDLRPLNVLIGANGAGKSNFILLFRLLNQLVEQNLQLFVAREGGADSLLHYGRRKTERLTIRLKFGVNAYQAVLVPTVDDRLVFERETVYFYGRGYSRPYEEDINVGDKESALPREARDHPGRVADHVLRRLRTWRVYHFHDTSDAAGIKRIGEINDNLYLRPDAANLAAFLFRLQAQAPQSYAAIRDTVRLVAPFFDDLTLRPSPENARQIRLEWRERGVDYPFLAHQLSDGTLRFVALATLLLQPELPSTVLIDEPELGLHPYAISTLASLIRSVSTKTQIILSTQSVPLVNQFGPDDLLVVERRGQESTIERVESERLEAWLDEYALGELWEKNVLGGRPTG